MLISRKWTSDLIADQQGRIAVVTGANSGIGYETARALARKNARVILACRTAEKGQQATDRILRDYPQATCRCMQLDLAKLQSVRDFAQAFRAGFLYPFIFEKIL